MMKMRMKLLLITALAIYACGGLAYADDYIQAKGAIQISSIISDGTHTIRDIVDIASAEGFKVVVITDRDLMRWQYGLWPVRRVIKMTIENNSIFKYGIKKYLQDIKDAQELHSDMVVLAGIESAPFYYWKEDFLKLRLSIKNWHRHLIAIGMDNAETIRRLPVTGNVAGLAMPFRPSDLGYILFPMLAFGAGIYFFTTKRFSFRRFHSILINVGNTRSRVFGVLMFIIGTALLIYAYPYRDMKFDQFRGDLGIRPYQNFIDYADKNGGLVFWAHPEAENKESQGLVDIATSEYSEVLLQSHGYTGYTVFYDGYERIGKPGGIWDDVLEEYCRGVRDNPVWAIGGMGLDRTVDLAKDLKDLRNVLLVKSLNRKDVMDALRYGRVYVARGANSGSFVLDSFTLRSTDKAAYKIMGEELITSSRPIVEIRGHFSYGEEHPVKIRLIRNGEVVKTFEEKSPISLSYVDESKLARKKYYYRLEIESKDLLLVANPIFFRIEK